MAGLPAFFVAGLTPCLFSISEDQPVTASGNHGCNTKSPGYQVFLNHGSKGPWSRRRTLEPLPNPFTPPILYLLPPIQLDNPCNLVFDWIKFNFNKLQPLNKTNSPSGVRHGLDFTKGDKEEPFSGSWIPWEAFVFLGVIPWTHRISNVS